jgi:macrolide-specific efflux system membrane fusion protein
MNNHLVSKLSWAKASIAGLTVAGCCLATRAADQPASPTELYPGYTTASEKRAQNFDVPGVVQKMFVKEGDSVKAGDMIAEQTLDAEKAHLLSLELGAKATDLEIQAEQAQLRKDKVELERKEGLRLKQAISQSELDEARLSVEIDSLKVLHAQQDKEKANADVTEQKARIELKKLRAKIDGVVSEINTREGELANTDTQHPTITIVKNDPLYVEVDLPSELVKTLKANPKMIPQVQYVDDKTTWHDAKIHFIKPEADPKSNTEHVELEIPNSEGRSSGLQVVVRMPQGAAPVGAAANATR